MYAFRKICGIYAKSLIIPQIILYDQYIHNHKNGDIYID